MKQVWYQDLGEIEYGKAWDLQESLLQQGLQIKSSRFAQNTSEVSQEEIKNYLFFCSHPHVLTLGKSGHMENILLQDTRLKELGISFYKTNRGGDITYHGPGQIVGYPVLDLEQFFTDLGRYMRNLEETVIRALINWGIVGDRLPGATGVWLDPQNPRKARKICAMGVRCSRWITIHGFALNVNTDLRYFDYIVPCGIKDKSVTSLQQELGHEVSEAEVKLALQKAFAEVFECELISKS